MLRVDCCLLLEDIVVYSFHQLNSVMLNVTNEFKLLRRLRFVTPFIYWERFIFSWESDERLFLQGRLEKMVSTLMKNEFLKRLSGITLTRCANADPDFMRACRIF